MRDGLPFLVKLRRKTNSSLGRARARKVQDRMGRHGTVARLGPSPSQARVELRRAKPHRARPSRAEPEFKPRRAAPSRACAWAGPSPGVPSRHWPSPGRENIWQPTLFLSLKGVLSQCSKDRVGQVYFNSVCFSKVRKNTFNGPAPYT